LNITGMHLTGPVVQWKLTGSGLDAENRIGQSPQVEVKETTVGNSFRSISVAPISVDIYRIPVAQLSAAGI
jgi:hypothetical protein